MKSIRILIAVMRVAARPAFAQVHTFLTDQNTWNSFVTCINDLMPCNQVGHASSPINLLPPQSGNYPAQGFQLNNVGAGTTAGDALAFGQTGAQLANCLLLNGSTSGGTSLCVAAIDGTTLFQFPTTNGAPGQVLTTDGTGVTSWQTSGGGFPLTANVSAATNKIQNQGVGTVQGDGIIFGLNHLNDMAPATNLYSMGNNKLQGLAAATVTNDAIAYGQAAAYLISATVDNATINGVLN